MAEYYNSGDCIDGARILIRFKKIQMKTFITSPTGFKGIKYRCSRDGSTEIKKVLPKEESDNAVGKKPSVHIEIGDLLKCENAYFIAQTRRKLNCFKTAMMSGRHECSEGTPDVRVYAEIETPFAGIANAVDKRLAEMKKQTELVDKKQTKALKSK